MMLTDGDIASLKPFFEPESIAILGASSDSTKPAGKTLISLMNRGYKGKIYPVNSKYQGILGIKCYPSLAEIPGKVDLVIISIPAEGVCDAIEQCIAKEAGAAVIFSSGFAEIGPEGRLLQENMTELARKSGIRLCGPNSVGVINTTNGVTAAFAFIVDIPNVDSSSLGFVTQSGAFGAFIYAQALASGVGLNYFVSVGNEADAEFADFLEYMIRDRSTKLVGGYLEGAKNGRKLRRVAEEAAKAQKPIMIMKVGRSKAGARAALSHTGSLAGMDRIYDAFFKQTGIIRIDGPEEITAFATLISAGRLPRGKNIAILATSGGAGVTLADACEGLGFALPMLNESTRAKMETLLPFFASAHNPIDLTGQYMTHPQILVTCFNALLEDDNIDIILANFDLLEPYEIEIARGVIDVYNSAGKTIVICPWIYPGTDEGEGVRELRRAGLPVFTNRNLAIRATAHLADYAEFLRKRESKEYKIPVLAGAEHSRVELNDWEGVLSEGQSKDLLARFGIPVTREGLAQNEDEAALMAGQIGYPVVLKVDSPDIPHKTDAGALVLNMASEKEVRRAYSGVLQNARKYKPDARINGVLVQEMLPEGIEVIIGVTSDPVFGPTIMLGLGGIFVETLKDVSFRVAPLSPGDALDMVREIKGYQVLKGVRGKPPADVDALVDVIMKISAMVTKLEDRIEEIDINPLMVYPAKMGVKAADAMVVLRR